MGKSAIMAGALVIGAAGGFGAYLVAGSVRSEARSPSRREDAPVVVESPDIGRLERRIDELAAALPLANAPGSPPIFESIDDEGEGEVAADASVADRLTSLENRISALEKSGGRQGPVVPKDLASSSAAELDALAKTLVRSKRHGDAQRVLKELLARTDIDAETRNEAEMQYGYSLRGEGKHAEAEQRFLDVIAREGEDSRKGSWAGFQVGWERYYQKDYAGASTRMEQSANASEVTPIIRVHSLYNAANFAKQAGDTGRAEIILTRLLDNHAGDIPATQGYMKTQAEAWLKEIRGD